MTNTANGPLRRSVLAGLAATTLLPAVARAQAKPTRYDQAMRWIQVAFTEDDPGRYDPKFWFDYARAIGADGICLSAGGGTAFYPSKLPLQRRARDLTDRDGGDRDLFGEMVAGCRKLNMSVIARIDPHSMGEAAFAAHPEWAMRTPDGKPRRHPSAPDLYLSCLNGPFMTDFVPQIITEVARSYDVDGFFGNRWGGWTALCHCDSCQAQFKTASGFDVPAALGDGYTMPAPGHPQEAAARAYLLWFQDMRFKQIKLWTETAQKVKPSLFFVGGPTLGMELDPNRLGAASPIQFIDHQLRRDLTPVWDNGRAAKMTRGFMGNKPVVGIFSPMWRWKDGAQSGPELQTWLADGVAQGFRPWVNKFNAKPFDTRWMPAVQARYNWLQKNEAALKNTGNLARVALVHSPETETFYGRAQAGAKVGDHQDGYYEALVEARIPFDMLDARQLDAEHVSRFRVLVLANVAVLSDAQCQQLRDFVKTGGRIVATHETSLYDETGKRRANFGLADLFGCNFAGAVDERLSNDYLTLHGPHPLLKGLDGVQRIMGISKRVQVSATDTSPPPLTFVPPYPDQPVERFFTNVPQTDIPMAFCHDVGKGRVVYFPMDIDRMFWEYLAVDHLALLRNAVEWAADEPATVSVTGGGMLDVSYWRQDKSLTVHLVNLTNPMFLKGPIREILPVGPFEVTVSPPPGVKITGARLLESGSKVAVKSSGGRIALTVPRVAVHEIIVLETA
jgi:hypothetical protein